MIYGSNTLNLLKVAILPSASTVPPVSAKEVSKCTHHFSQNYYTSLSIFLHVALDMEEKRKRILLI